MSIRDQIRKIDKRTKAKIKEIGPKNAAQLVGCTASYLSLYYRGEKSLTIDKILEIAEKLGIQE